MRPAAPNRVGRVIRDFANSFDDVACGAQASRVRGAGSGLGALGFHGSLVPITRMEGLRQRHLNHVALRRWQEEAQAASSGVWAPFRCLPVSPGSFAERPPAAEVPSPTRMGHRRLCFPKSCGFSFRRRKGVFRHWARQGRAFLGFQVTWHSGRVRVRQS